MSVPGPRQVDRALELMGLTRAEVMAPLNEPTRERAQAALDALKKRMKSAYRRASRELHPDFVDGREDDFKLVSAVYNQLRDLELTTRRRPAPVAVQSAWPGHVTVVRVNWTGSATTSSSTTNIVW